MACLPALFVFHPFHLLMPYLTERIIIICFSVQRMIFRDIMHLPQHMPNIMLMQINTGELWMNGILKSRRAWSKGQRKKSPLTILSPLFLLFIYSISLLFLFFFFSLCTFPFAIRSLQLLEYYLIIISKQIVARCNRAMIRARSWVCPGSCGPRYPARLAAASS